GAQFPADGRVPGGRPRRASAGGDRETRILDAVVVDQAILWDGSKDLLWCQRTNARRIAGEAQIKVRIALAYALRKSTGRAVKVDCRRGTGCEVRIRCAPHPGQRRMRNSEAAAYNHLPVQHIPCGRPGESESWLPSVLIDRQQIARSAAASGEAERH